jgi:tRNA nucleotidyltransferase (CCA-adding enzyme)
VAAASPHWEHFCHGADIGIRGIGATPQEAFAQAGLAMTAAMTDVDRVRPSDEITIECAGTDLEDLFFAFIDALVFEMSTRKMVFSQFDVRIDRGQLHARIRGESVDRERHEPAVEVKGPTLTELHVSQNAADGVWTAQCVVDV